MCFWWFWESCLKPKKIFPIFLKSPSKILYAYFLSRWISSFFYFRPLIHGNRYMKIFVNMVPRNFKFIPKIIKSIQEKEKNKKNSFFDLGRNPMEIVHRPLFISWLVWIFFLMPWISVHAQNVIATLVSVCLTFLWNFQREPKFKHLC